MLCQEKISLLRWEKVARAKRVTDEVSLSQGKSTRAYSSICNACLCTKSFYRRIRFSRELRARSSAVADVHRKSALCRSPSSPYAKKEPKLKPQGFNLGSFIWRHRDPSCILQSIPANRFLMLCKILRSPLQTCHRHICFTLHRVPIMKLSHKRKKAPKGTPSIKQIYLPKKVKEVRAFCSYSFSHTVYRSKTLPRRVFSLLRIPFL